MKKIVFATNNTNKLIEAKSILTEYDIIPMKDIGFTDDIVEYGLTFEENAIIKAQAVRSYLKLKNLNLPVLADDTGLCVDVLDGQPGVYSARYSGEHGNGANNRKKLLNKLKGKTNRAANFSCAVAYIDENDKVTVAMGFVNGEILPKEQGSSGFGYDSIFYSHELGMSFAMCTQEEKNKISHRGRALCKLKENLLSK